MPTMETEKPKKPRYLTKRFSYPLGRNHCRKVVAFLYVRANPETGTVHVSQGLRHWGRIVHPGTRFTGGKWKDNRR